MIITLRLEAMLLHRQQNLSEWNGQTHAFNVAEDSSVPTGGDIYDGNSLHGHLAPSLLGSKTVYGTRSLTSNATTLHSPACCCARATPTNTD